MRGRSPFNKPSIRKDDLYRLLLENGGELRWKNLKEKVRETLHWGPTTLKETLDQLILTCPFDSIENVAANFYPKVLVGLVLKDTFVVTGRLSGAE